jgi:hypothetical protein
MSSFLQLSNAAERDFSDGAENLIDVPPRCMRHTDVLALASPISSVLSVNAAGNSESI